MPVTSVLGDAKIHWAALCPDATIWRPARVKKIAVDMSVSRAMSMRRPACKSVEHLT